MRQQGGFFYWVKIIIIIAIIGAGFFCGQKNANGANGNIMISQIMVGQVGATDDEFIELYNSTDNDIDLSGYSIQYRGSKSKTFYRKNFITSLTIRSKGYFLIVSTQYGGGVAFDLKQGTFNLSGDGGTIFLVSNQITLTDDTAASSIVLDRIAYGKGSYLFPESIVYSTVPSPGKSLARQITNGVMKDTDNNANDFEIKDSPTPQNSSSPKLIPTGGQTNEQNNNVASSTDLTLNPLLSKEREVNFGDVLINELVSDPADDEVEWIELYNKANREIDLTGWWIEEGSKAKTKLAGIIGASGSGRYKIIEKPAGSLNNSGDIIILYEPGGKIIDQLAYGNWDDGNMEDNALAAADPKSTARKFDGNNTYNNLNDFAVTLKPTKGMSNIIQIEDEVSAEAKAKFDFSNDIFISEILPNPIGDDTKLEFIEIYNAGKREVNLTGWSLSNEDGKKKNWENIATSTIIKADEYLAFFRPRTKIVLHNDAGEARLYQPLSDKPMQIVKYKNVKDGYSYNANLQMNANSANMRINNEDWEWSEMPTPGAINIFKTINHAPEVEFSFKSPALINVPVMFDSSDTNDQDGDKLKFSWDFGDGFKNNLANPEHTYLKVGIYRVKLEVSDGQETAEKEKSVRVVSSVDEMANVLDSRLRGNDKIEEVARNDKIIINEIFPNPAGADTGQEWLELKNQSSSKVNFLNWRVENSNGKYKFKNDLWLDAANFYLLTNQESKLAFKNADDIISLYNSLDELVDQVEYASAVQGETYALGANGNWFWTTKMTPTKENIISLAGSKSEIVTKVSKAAGGTDDYIKTTLGKIKELDIGSLVIVKGTVAVEPGVLGVQIFYIVGSPGMQIYNYKKDFPALKIGDYIEVTGELTQTQGEFRVKTKDKSDIKIVGRKQPPLALAVKGDEVSEENIGQFIIITGEITDKKSASLYVDDGSDEIFVYIKKNTGITTKNLAAGQKVSVTGVLSKTQTGLRLLPRYQADIVLINQTSELTPQVLGEVVSAQEWDLAERDKKLELFKYLLIIASGIIIILGILFIKSKRKS